MKHKIKMIGFDLDGTVLDSKKRLPKENARALSRAAEKGVVILPATGRPKAGVPREVLEIPGVRYLLSSNGSRIVDLHTGKTVHEALFGREATLRMAKRLAAIPGCIWEIYWEGRCFVDKGTYHFVEHPAMSEELLAYLKKSRIFREDLLGVIEREGLLAEKFQTFYAQEDQRRPVLEYLAGEPEAVVSSSAPFNLEINSAKAGKGNGLLALGRLLGIEREEILAIGDSSNDWDMLKKVGFPVAMGNADEETKKLAKAVVPANNENGVAAAIERYVLA